MPAPPAYAARQDAQADEEDAAHDTAAEKTARRRRRFKAETAPEEQCEKQETRGGWWVEEGPFSVGAIQE